MGKARTEAGGKKSSDPAKPSTAERIFFAGLVLAALSPFVWMPSPDLEYVGNLRFVGLMLSAGLLLLALAAQRTRWPRVEFRLWAGGLAALSAVAVFSAVAGESRLSQLTFGAELSRMSAPTWLALCLIALCATLPVARRRSVVLLSILVAGACVAVVVGTWQYVRGGFVSGLFANGNFLGTVVVCCVPVALLLARRLTGPRRIVALCALALLAWGLWIAGSATVWAVACVQILVLAALAPHLAGVYSPKVRAVLRGVALVGVAIGVAVLVAWRVAPVVLPQRVAVTLDTQVAGPTLLSRMALWDMALRIWAEHPLIGVGPDGLDLATQSHLNQNYLMRSVVDDGTRMLMRDPHLLPLLLASTFGLVGLAAALSVAVGWALALRRSLQPAGQPGRDGALLLAAGTVSFFACMLLIPWSIRFGALPSLMAGLSLGSAPGDTSPDPRTPARDAAGNPVAARIALVVAAVGFLWLGAAAFVGQYALTRSATSMDPQESLSAARLARRVQPTRAAAAQRETEVLGELMLGGLARPEDLVAAYDAIPADQRAAAPFDAAVARTALDFIFLYGASPQFRAWASAHAQRALDTAPGLPEAQVELAHALILQGKIARANQLIDSAEQVSYPSPRLDVYRYYIAGSTGDTATAEILGRKVIDQSPEFAPLLQGSVVTP